MTHQTDRVAVNRPWWSRLLRVAPLVVAVLAVATVIVETSGPPHRGLTIGVVAAVLLVLVVAWLRFGPGKLVLILDAAGVELPVGWRGSGREEIEWEQVDRVRAKTELRLLGYANFRYVHFLLIDVANQSANGGRPSTRRIRFDRGVVPSLDEVLRLIRAWAPGAPVTDERRFGMLESMRRDSRRS